MFAIHFYALALSGLCENLFGYVRICRFWTKINESLEIYMFSKVSGQRRLTQRSISGLDVRSSLSLFPPPPQNTKHSTTSLVLFSKQCVLEVSEHSNYLLY
jgi:hypothetical protein